MIPIVILAGQSNMLGHGELSDIDSPLLPPEVKLFDLNPRDGCFGPEVGFARTFLENEQLENLWLIKYAVGGSSLLAWEPEWSAERAAITDDVDKGALYQRLINHFRQVTQGVEADVLACLWMQGENDSRHERAATQYEANLKRFISSLRRDLAAPDMAFILGLANPPPDPWYHVETVRSAQRNTAQDCQNVTLVETAGLSKKADDLHCDTAGQLELGKRFADKLCQHLRHNAEL